MPTVYFKGEDFDDELGTDVGPILVVDDAGKVLEDRGWGSRTEAKLLAEKLGHPVEIDGPPDEELEKFRS